MENDALYCGISDDPPRCFDTYCSGEGTRFFHSSPTHALACVGACASKGDTLHHGRAIEAPSKHAKGYLLVDVPVLREVDESAVWDVHLRSWGICGLPEESLVGILDPSPRLQASR